MDLLNTLSGGLEPWEVLLRIWPAMPIRHPRAPRPRPAVQLWVLSFASSCPRSKSQEGSSKATSDSTTPITQLHLQPARRHPTTGAEVKPHLTAFNNCLPMIAFNSLSLDCMKGLLCAGCYEGDKESKSSYLRRTYGPMSMQLSLLCYCHFPF